MCCVVNMCYIILPGDCCCEEGGGRCNGSCSVSELLPCLFSPNSLFFVTTSSVGVHGCRGLKPKGSSLGSGSVSKQELAEVCRRQSVEEKEETGEERMQGLGFAR